MRNSLRGAPEVPPLCRETQSLGQQMFGINGLIPLIYWPFICTVDLFPQTKLKRTPIFRTITPIPFPNYLRKQCLHEYWAPVSRRLRRTATDKRWSRKENRDNFGDKKDGRQLTIQTQVIICPRKQRTPSFPRCGHSESIIAQHSHESQSSRNV